MDINNSAMEGHRLQELNYLLRTNTPVPVTESRNSATFDDELYDDVYTISELIEEGHLEYLGKDSNSQLYLRPVHDFSVYIMKEVSHLQGGELIKLALTKSGQVEFDTWIQGKKFSS